MPKGTSLTTEQKKILVRNLAVLNHDSDFIHHNIFYDIISKQYCDRLCQKILNMTQTERDNYTNVNSIRGTKRKLTEEVAGSQYLERVVKENRTMILSSITRKFHEEFYSANSTSLPSLSTVYKQIKKKNSRKMVTWKNINRDPAEQLAFLERIAHVPPERLIDIDGIIQNPADFHAKYGWSPIGQECRALQIIINERVYAVHAAVTEQGFMAWDIFEGAVTDIEVGNFVTKLKDHRNFNNLTFGILDNAANQRTERVRSIMERIFAGKYLFCSPYSPELKPIERAFSLIRKYISAHYDQSVGHLDQINAAFNHYSDAPGQHGNAIYGMFNIYRRNHELYLDSRNAS